MNLTLAYRGKSAVVARPAGLDVTLAPNLRRDRVGYEGRLRHPIRFREAIAALHDVVVGDFRHVPRDKSAYEAYKAEQTRRESELRRLVTSRGRVDLIENQVAFAPEYVSAIEKQYKKRCRRYWDVRQKYSNHLYRHDPELWRLLIPCDPVITVAPDCLFFECFSADESSYGCLTVARDAFEGETAVDLGTTNVDYSWALYEHFQKLRSYRETRFSIDPTGFDVRTGEAEGYREEKIDLPPSWLRGFMQLQAAMALPMRRVPLSREGLYALLAFLKRHRAARSPRAIRFELERGRPVAVVLEPWEERIVLHGTKYDGPRDETIRVWGRDRLRVLARLLPLMDEAEVYLLGTGLPSYWSVRMGEMRFLLGLSGWTANDWTGASALDQLAPPAVPSDALLAGLARAFLDSPALGFEEARRRTGEGPAQVAAGLNRLALLGQVVHDLHAGLYRWRQIMPVALSLDQIGPEHPETEAARGLVERKAVRLSRDESRADGLRILEGEAGGRPVSLLLDADGRMLRGRCTCSHHFTGGLRKGPCRHLQALRTAASNKGEARASSLEEWFRTIIT
jgi:hypothetical protein